MSAVIKAPKPTPFRVEEVNFFKMPSVLPPASFSRLLPINVMPNKKRARPPKRDIPLNKVIGLSFHQRCSEEQVQQHKG